MFGKKKKEKAPFNRGNLISDGEKRRIVNVKPFKVNGSWKMLIDRFKWDGKDQYTLYCEEVFCSNWNLIKK